MNDTEQFTVRNSIDKPLRVLLLEDQETDAELMVRELKRAGFNPQWERIDTEQQFLTRLEDPCDLILSDNTLPAFNALAALTHLRERRIDIPVVIVSGSIGEEQAVALLHHGAADYVMKDRPDRLGAAVARVLQEKRLRDDNREAHEALHARSKELLQSQDRLRALASELTLTEQRERRKLATDLHDYLAQLLVVGRMKLRQAMGRIANASERELLKDLDHILNDSLEYTRTLITDLAPPTLQEFGLIQALQWLCEQMKAHALAVSVQTDSDRIDLPDDQAILVFQSIRELLFNVVKHAETHEATISVATDSNTELRITIEDKGVGFDQDALSSRDSATARFGLFSIEERMRAMGGRLEIDSASGRGSRVAMVLPYWPLSGTAALTATHPTLDTEQGLSVSQLPPSPMEESGVERVGSASESTRVRVLLVDDHAMVREGIKSILGNHQGFRVIGEAADGKRAVEMAKELRPEVVIMDVNLPVLDGVMATGMICRECPDVIVIGLSVHDDRHFVEALKAAGAAAFVSKGCLSEELYGAIDQALREKELRENVRHTRGSEELPRV
ncbi:MAG: response regulator [Nitrospira sp.]